VNFLTFIAAISFTNWYYDAINDERHAGIRIGSAYTTNSAAYRAAGQDPADISINSERVATPAELEAKLVAQRKVIETFAPLRFKDEVVRHKVESLDVHVINYDYRVGASEAALRKKDRDRDLARLMISVSVGGTVKFGPSTTAHISSFDEMFVLVPNWEVYAQQRAAKNARRFLILAQKFKRRG
jgi:hypothetical protein